MLGEGSGEEEGGFCYPQSNLKCDRPERSLGNSLSRISKRPVLGLKSIISGELVSSGPEGFMEMVTKAPFI